MHVYHDDGLLGGFAELECSCQSIGRGTGRKSRTDQIISWIYVGLPEKIKEIALYILRIEI
ncbi:MAG: hypothetical protein ACYCXQ_08110 [Candidatus Humimicrobiaceae bacterium]